MGNNSKVSAEEGDVRLWPHSRNWVQHLVPPPSLPNPPSTIHLVPIEADAGWANEMMGATKNTRASVAKYIRKYSEGLGVPDTTFRPLLKIYLRQIQPIFPIFWRDRLLGIEDSDNRIITRLIRLAVCLAASLSPEAAAHLRLKAFPGVIAAVRFASAVSYLIRTLLNHTPYEDNTLDRIRVETLTALFWKSDLDNDWGVPMDMFARTVSLFYSAGLHLPQLDNVVRRGLWRTVNFTSQNQLEKLRPFLELRQAGLRAEAECLFLCMYTVDRLLACTYGRPTLIQEHDIQRDMTPSLFLHPPCFRVLVHLIGHLDQVLRLYRPGASGGAGTVHCNACEVPDFETIMTRGCALDIPTSFSATLEIFYHSIVILSFRDGSPPWEPQSVHLEVPDGHIRAQRAIAASRIIQLSRNNHPIAMPFIPYAISLAVASGYRIWRSTKVPAYREQGRTIFQSATGLILGWKSRCRLAYYISGRATSLQNRIDATTDDMLAKIGSGEEEENAYSRVNLSESPEQPPPSDGAIYLAPRGGGGASVVLRALGPEKASKSELLGRMEKLYHSSERRTLVNERDGSRTHSYHYFANDRDALRDSLWCNGLLDEPAKGRQMFNWDDWDEGMDPGSIDPFRKLIEEGFDLEETDSFFYSLLIPTFPFALHKFSTQHYKALDAFVWPKRWEPTPNQAARYQQPPNPLYSSFEQGVTYGPEELPQVGMEGEAWKDDSSYTQDGSHGTPEKYDRDIEEEELYAATEASNHSEKGERQIFGEGGLHSPPAGDPGASGG